MLFFIINPTMPKITIFLTIMMLTWQNALVLPIGDNISPYQMKKIAFCINRNRVKKNSLIDNSQSFLSFLLYIKPNDDLIKALFTSFIYFNSILFLKPNKTALVKMSRQN